MISIVWGCQDFWGAEFSSRTFVNLDPLSTPFDSNSAQKRHKLFGPYSVLFAEAFSLSSYSFPLRNLLHNPTAASLLTGWPRGSLVRIFDRCERSTLPTAVLGRSRVFFDVEIGSRKEGRIVFELVCHTAPFIIYH